MDQKAPRRETRKNEARHFSESIRFSEYGEARSHQLTVRWEQTEKSAAGVADIPPTAERNERKTETNEHLEPESYIEGDRWKPYSGQEDTLTLNVPPFPVGETPHDSDSTPDPESCDSKVNKSYVQPNSMEVGEDGSNVCPDWKLSTKISPQPDGNNTTYDKIVTQLIEKSGDGFSELCAVAENMTAALNGALGRVQKQQQLTVVVADSDSTPSAPRGGVWEKKGASCLGSVPSSPPEEEEREKWSRLWRELVLKNGGDRGLGLMQMRNYRLSSSAVSAVVDSVVMRGGSRVRR